MFRATASLPDDTPTPTTSRTPALAPPTLTPTRRRLCAIRPVEALCPEDGAVSRDESKRSKRSQRERRPEARALSRARACPQVCFKPQCDLRHLVSWKHHSGQPYAEPLMELVAMMAAHGSSKETEVWPDASELCYRHSSAALPQSVHRRDPPHRRRGHAHRCGQRWRTRMRRAEIPRRRPSRIEAPQVTAW